MNLDPVVLLNLTFDVVIVLLGVFVHQRKKNQFALWVAVAFALFGISYVLTIAEVTSSWVLVPIRTLGYLSVVLGLILSARNANLER